MAARVAARLKTETNLDVDTVTGGLGEFSVYVGEQKAIETSRLWYPRQARVIERVKDWLAAQQIS